jgi:ABC-type hemin transport system ATPase subunit
MATAIQAHHTTNPHRYLQPPLLPGMRSTAEPSSSMIHNQMDRVGASEFGKRTMFHLSSGDAVRLGLSEPLLNQLHRRWPFIKSVLKLRSVMMDLDLLVAD